MIGFTMLLAGLFWLAWITATRTPIPMVIDTLGVGVGPHKPPQPYTPACLACHTMTRVLLPRRSTIP